MKKIAMLAAAATLLLGACAAPAPTVSKDDAMAAIDMAKQETAAAAKVNYEWRDTGKIIKQAEEAMKKEDYATAVKLANKAKNQSSNALMQYEDQKNAGPRI
jgi:starvation-inducible outer membrane lipoprotein